MSYIPPGTFTGDGRGEARPSVTDGADISGDVMHIHQQPMPLNDDAFFQQQQQHGGDYSDRSSEQSNNGSSRRASTSSSNGVQSRRGSAMSGISTDSRGYGGGRRVSMESASSATLAPGERLRRASEDTMTNASDFYDSRSLSASNRSLDASNAQYYSKSIFEAAQSHSSSNKGSLLFGSSFSSGLSTSRRRTIDQQPSALRRSNNSGSSNIEYSRIHPGSVSLSGNPLVHVHIEEDETVSLDMDEIRAMAKMLSDNNKSDYSKLKTLNDETTIGTTLSARSELSKNSSTRVVDNNPNSAILMENGDVDRGRVRLKEFIFSPPFRRSVVLGIFLLLFGLGLLLTLQNFMRVMTAEDWIEPHRDKHLMYGDGGIDWIFGSDAPQPIAGATIDYAIEYHIADWARGTSRVPPEASADGFGSVALSETVMFKDLPFFWGLPFTGSSILESTLGQCLHLTQASDGKGTEEGKGFELHLSKSFVQGNTYLNVDLSHEEGIERAIAMSLGTSGLADVVYSPLLHEMSEMFTTMKQGRLFIMVRHPVEKEFARLRYMRKWDHGKLLEDEDRHMSYAEFAQSKYVADNWMTRTLVQKGEDEDLTAQDLYTAKEILRRKAFIALYSDIPGALRKYARYFGWDNAMNGGKLDQGTMSCFEKAILDGMRKDTYGLIDLDEQEAHEGSLAWEEIVKKNRFDIELYLYSQQLYKFQISLS